MSDYRASFAEYMYDSVAANKREYEYRVKHPILARIQDVYWATWRFCRYSEIRYKIRKVYWFFLRGWRGWAPNDTWSLDTYLDVVIRDAVEHLRKNHMGYPSQLATPEEWDNILHRISFLADRHLGMVEGDFKYTAQEYEETTKELFDLLEKYWGNLWD